MKNGIHCLGSELSHLFVSSELLLRLSRRLLAFAPLSAPIYVRYHLSNRQEAKEEKSETNPPNPVDSSSEALFSRSSSSWLTGEKEEIASGGKGGKKERNEGKFTKTRSTSKKFVAIL